MLGLGGAIVESVGSRKRGWAIMLHEKEKLERDGLCPNERERRGRVRGIVGRISDGYDPSTFVRLC